MPPKASKTTSKKRVCKMSADYSEDSCEFEGMTVAALRKLCTERGLDTKGVKVVLIQRLMEDDQQNGEPPVKLKKAPSLNTRIKKEMEKKALAPSKRKYKVDEHFPQTSYAVYEDYACMLNQTNINQNNNKYYVIQLLTAPKKTGYAIFTRWGRVGEIGQQIVSYFTSLDAALKEFKKKFKDKTKNDWDNRETFTPAPGKYTLLDIADDDDDDDNDDDDEEEEEKKEEEKKAKPPKARGTNEVYKGEQYVPCSLDVKTKALVSLIFDEDMFQQSMQAMDLDVKKMPLGKLSKTQIAKGFDALVSLEQAIKSQKPKTQVQQLTSTFYTLIPHSFGRQVPPLIDTPALVQKKKDMLLVLSDIELAQCLQKDKKLLDTSNATPLKPHPLDEKYSLLGCKLTLLGEKSNEFKVIKTYVEKTSQQHTKLKDVWIVDRVGEDKRFKIHESIKERKLLWHGTNVAVVTAILSSGLRIMPHSGGRVGRGIYFASEQDKSAGYVQYAPDGTGIMFLNEVALGKEFTITSDDSNLIAAPKAYDCVVARGTQEPDPKSDTTIKLEGKDVVVPQGKPIKSGYNSSSFYQSEYLIYKESQARIRYLLTFKWGH